MDEAFPYLFAEQVPPLQQELCQLVADELSSWSSYMSGFESALTLIAFADDASANSFAQREALTEKMGKGVLGSSEWRLREEPLRRQVVMYGKWSLIAFRDAAMTLFHLRQVLNSILKAVKQAPTVEAYADMALLGEADTLFETHFREATDLRNAVGHSAQNKGSLQKQKFNSDTAAYNSSNIRAVEGVRRLFSAMRDGDRLVATLGERTVSLTVNREAWQHLTEIQDKLFKSFMPLSNAMRAARIERRPMPPTP